MIVQSSLETRQQLRHKQHFFSSPCLTPSRFFQQACISPSANLSCFPFLSPRPEFIPLLITLPPSLSLSISLSDFLLPSPIPPHLLTCCHTAVPARCFHPSLCHSYLLPCSLHISSTIDSQSLHPYRSNSPVCSSASSHAFSFTSVRFFFPLPASTILLSVWRTKFVFLNNKKKKKKIQPNIEKLNYYYFLSLSKPPLYLFISSCSPSLNLPKTKSSSLFYFRSLATFLSAINLYEGTFLSAHQS